MAPILLPTGAKPDYVTRQYSDEAFNKYYAEKIHPHVEKFEEKRLAAATSVNLRWKIAIVPFALACVFLLYAAIIWRWPFSGLAITGAVQGIGIIGWIYSKAFSYEGDIKSVIFPIIVAFFGDAFRFHDQKTNPTDINALKKSSVFSDVDKCTVGDYICGVYKDVSIALTECRFSKGSGKNEKTLFSGLAITLGIKKSFRGRIIVKKDAGAMGNFFGDSFGLERVRLEDPAFEKMFEVYGSDQIDTRMLLTPDFMERLLRLSRQYGNSVECSFSGNKLALFLPTDHNFFEVHADLDKKCTFHDEIATVRTEIGMIFDLIDALKLDNKTGL